MEIGEVIRYETNIPNIVLEKGLDFDVENHVDCIEFRPYPYEILKRNPIIQLAYNNVLVCHPEVFSSRTRMESQNKCEKTRCVNLPFEKRGDYFISRIRLDGLKMKLNFYVDTKRGKLHMDVEGTESMSKKYRICGYISSTDGHNLYI